MNASCSNFEQLGRRSARARRRAARGIRSAHRAAATVCIDDKAKAVAQRVRRNGPKEFESVEARQGAASELPLGAASRRI